MKKFFLFSFIFIQSLIINAQHLDSLLQPLKYRNIGPFRGGRSVSVSGVVGDPLTYYMGTTGGGLWKTADGGSSWHNISDGFFKTGSVGAVAVSESNPNIIYCGMGEHAPRAVMTSYGDGVYKSNDSGKTWIHLGLEETQHISRIVIHPENPDIVYVAAQGALYGPNEERGIFKSNDGGKSWKKVLFVNSLTGCSELSIDVKNPEVLYAAMWEHQRKPWKVISGGEGSGLYKSIDGGESWIELKEGLPEEMGKMAIAVSRSNSDRVYALIESDWEEEKGGLFISKNGGKTFSKVSGDHRLIQRAWYYIELFIDPLDEETVYVLSAPALRSIDGGKTWERITGTHGDFHDLWINPNNNRNLAIANDGGAAISYNYGDSWSTQSNMPTAQFYRVTVDNLYPYNIYGGQQDNTSVKIASLALGRGSINEQNWTYSAGGESAFLAFDPDNPRYVMGGSYLGTVEMLDTKTESSTQVMAAPIQYLGRDAKDMKFRYNWNAPIIWSKHEPGTFYHAAQYLLRSRDMGLSWEVISPDLSKNEKDKQGKAGGPYTNEAVGAENYGTISYVTESQHNTGHIWIGTDDGLVQMTTDGGDSWTNVTPKGMPETLVNAIEISPHDPSTVYIATTRYKFNDYTPAIYKSTNYGKTWKNISEGIPYGAFTRVVREDEKKEGLLFAGTEKGMFISRNGGERWEPFQLNLPVVPITDLIIRHDDMVVATMGRSFWVMDDLDLVRQFVVENKSLKLYKPEDAHIGNWYSQMNSSSEDVDGTDLFEGVNPANGVVFYYYVPDESSDIELIIKDDSGKVIRSLKSSPDPDFQTYPGGPSPEPTLMRNKGLNRFVWDMRHQTLVGAPTAYIEGSFRGHKAIPGSYSAELFMEDEKSTVDFKILPNPLYEISPDQYAEYDLFMTDGEAKFNEMHQTVNMLLKARNQLEEVISEIDDNGDTALNQKGEQLLEKLKAWDGEMIQRKSKAYDDVENFPNKFTAEYIFLLNQAHSDRVRINEPSRERKAELDEQWFSLKKEAEKLLQEEIPAYNKLLWEKGLGAIRPQY